jgi:hypothetical protein
MTLRSLEQWMINVPTAIRASQYSSVEHVADGTVHKGKTEHV